MTQVGPVFFQRKRPWSKYKDRILADYLREYVPKVVVLKRPVVIVDCFAGPGMFGDGELGSPLIIANIVSQWRSKQYDIRSECIEFVEENFQKLNAHLAPHREYCTARCASFNEVLPELVSLAKTHTVFLYVDPYNVRQLVFEQLLAVYQQIHRYGSSVEVLMNFNASGFMRWAIAALGRVEKGSEFEGIEWQGDDADVTPEISELCAIAGGDYWVSIASQDSVKFPAKVEAFVAGFRSLMAKTFRYVSTYGVKERYESKVPKYSLLYGTRHEKGAELMSKVICMTHRAFVSDQSPKDRLFDMTPENENINVAGLSEAIKRVVAVADGPVQRPRIRLDVLKAGFFGRVTSSEINTEVTNLLKSKALFSDTGKHRITDLVFVSCKPFAND